MPNIEAIAMSDRKCVKIILVTNLRQDSDKLEMRNDLTEWKRRCTDCLNTKIKQLHLNSLEKSIEIGNNV